MKHILFVDDNELITKIVKRLLEGRSNYSVTTVLGVRDAIKVIGETERFDLAIIDLRLPNGTPMQVTDAVRKKFADIPILYISGAYDDDYPDTMKKPFSIDEIFSAVRERLGE